jgi:cobalt-zinc-cadmium resistance protein CzcA
VQRPLATVVIGGVIGAMVMSLLVLRVLYLVFDAVAHWVAWLAIRCGVNEKATRNFLGLDVDDEGGENGGDERGEPVGADARNGSADAPNVPAQVP